jgi:hypothetical protein
VKCDRTPGSCLRCIKYDAECSYPVEQAAGSDLSVPSKQGTDGRRQDDSGMTEAGIKRVRKYRSCLECRRAKTKCSGDAVCSRCNIKNLRCLYVNLDPRGSSSAAGPAPEQGHNVVDNRMPTWLVSSALPHADRVRQPIDIYLSLVHTVRCFGFLHVPSHLYGDIPA